MNTNNLKMIAKVVMNRTGQFEVDELIKEGKLDKVKEYLLVGIDSSWAEGALSFEDAAGFYNLLELPPERASMFRQKNVGVLYS